ncbi:MAG: glutamine--fructose-6-phosphate transaminase (isomerizing) [Candidatus Diapherotrites archaeon]|uniref:Glutamine--fructose-6-phosphate aminotransferase [isomerizing] n=1 Tax=Candidatus Iainarchaeum sp. TaxID=3101447 RepID=A0A2D6LQ43_9ARCH|nr:glutamine--fructose-6-phosphate transaminase (isomerizing) [Candidatus Diapherotrites archaeon]
MCGIIGIKGSNATEQAFSGLKALEYRGYDSWGIAYPTNNEFSVEKKTGHISNSNPVFSDSSIAIGHTRWATHGNVSERNAHPHLSMDGKIALVHNGIVENFAELKKSLLEKNYAFKSDTDSEIIVNLIQEKMKSENSFEEAVRKSLLEIDGSYAIVAIHQGEDKLVCARNGSPLVLGFGESFFVASDATAFIGETKKVYFLNDNEMSVISLEPKVFDVASGKEINFETKELTWSFEQAQKGSYPHFMLKEISEQPKALELAIEQPKEKLDELTSLIKSSEKVFLIGCGTSYHACVAGSYFFSNAGLHVETILASEFSRVENFLNEKTLVVALSQSGETADLLDAVKAAKKKGAKIASIVNVMDSSLMRTSDVSILMNAGPEICVLSTKSYTSQLAILLLLAYSVVGKNDEAKQLVKETASKIESLISSSKEEMELLAEKLANKKNIFVIGRSEAFPAALESALKIKEVSYIHAEGFAGAELKHGTIALIEEGTPAIVLCTPETRAEVLSNAIEMKSRGALTIGVDSKEHSEFDFNIAVPDCGNANIISLIIPIQLLSYFLALKKGFDPDKPRNLAKSVTVK